MKRHSLDELDIPKLEITDVETDSDHDVAPFPTGEIALDGHIEQDNTPVGASCPRKVDDKAAKAELRATLAKAAVQFGPIKMKPTKTIADNDNYGESWPLMEQLVRTTFERDKFKRARLVNAARHLRRLIDTAGLDVLSLSVHVVGKDAPIDFDLQRDEDGRVMFADGLTLDRKPKVHKEKNGEIEAERHDGPVRTGRGGRVDNSGFDPSRDEPAAFRKVSAGDELEEIMVSVGPLWLSLLAATSHNKTVTEIGECTGAKHAQASGVGTAIIRIALEAVAAAMERFGGNADGDYLAWLKKQPAGTAVPARRLKRALEALKAA